MAIALVMMSPADQTGDGEQVLAVVRLHFSFPISPQLMLLTCTFLCHVDLPNLYLCICVVVFVYLLVTHSGTLFLRSSYHNLFKNIAHVRPICKFDPNCICVFACPTLSNIVFEVLVPLPFQKYSTC